MDANEDGELTRLEMVRAFRLDERVRELIQPLMPGMQASRSSVTGDDLQEQVEGFERIFKMMDADGSDGERPCQTAPSPLPNRSSALAAPPTRPANRPALLTLAASGALTHGLSDSLARSIQSAHRSCRR